MVEIIFKPAQIEERLCTSQFKSFVIAVLISVYSTCNVIVWLEHLYLSFENVNDSDFIPVDIIKWLKRNIISQTKSVLLCKKQHARTVKM